MAKRSAAALDACFAALADPTRRALVEALATGEATVTELAKPFHVSLAAISKHLDTLEEAGLVERQRKGRERICRLRPGPLREPAEYLNRYRRMWEAGP